LQIVFSEGKKKKNPPGWVGKIASQLTDEVQGRMSGLVNQSRKNQFELNN
jgi:hypothetical protein